MSGGDAMPEAEGDMELVPPNLTTHPEHGRLAAWTEDGFVARLRGGRVHAGSPMPWENYRLMTDSDLRSLHRYLVSLPPSDHDVGPDRREVGWKAPK